MANEQNQGQEPAEEQKQKQTPIGDSSEEGNEQQKRAPGTEREYPGDTPEQRRGPGQEEDGQSGETERKRA